MRQVPRLAPSSYGPASLFFSWRKLIQHGAESRNITYQPNGARSLISIQISKFSNEGFHLFCLRICVHRRFTCFYLHCLG